MVKAHTKVDGKVIISDLRGVDPIYSGNRFMIYSMYPVRADMAAAQRLVTAS